MSIISSIGNGLSTFGRAIAGGFGQIVGLGGSFFYWLFGILDFGLGLLGIRPGKKLHLKVVIPREIDSNSLSIQQEVQDSIEFAKTILKREANVTVVAAEEVFVETLFYAAPSEALDVGCGFDAWVEDFGVVGRFFRLHSAVIPIRSQIGYGPPVTAFIVDSVANGDSIGCSLGPLTNYVTVSDDGGLTVPQTGSVSKTLAHEIGHACDLTHTNGPNNLMTRSSQAPNGTTLTHGQKARFRWSQHVTYF